MNIYLRFFPGGGKFFRPVCRKKAIFVGLASGRVEYLMQQRNDSYTIKLPQFEGPFDLLLFFIERDELDIYDIPIATITDDFLEYIRHMEDMNIDLASEFILVAATLCRIKARILIPRKPIDEEGNEIDPREELVKRLLEYKRYRSILDDMRKLEKERSLRSYRGNVSKELQSVANKALAEAELESVTLYKLLRAFERVMERYEYNQRTRVVHTVMKYNYTIQDQQSFIFNKISRKKPSSFESLFSGLENRIHAIVTFLALLEMLNRQMIKITQGLGVNNFWVSHPSDEEE